MTRLSYVDPDSMSAEQRALYDSIAKGPRAAARRSLVDAQGHLTGPFNAYLHNPQLGAHWSAIGESLRFHTKLSRRLFELAILVVAVHWRSGHEWAAHAGLARQEGVSDAVVVAILGGEYPPFQKDDEEIVYRFVHALVVERRAGDRVYAAAATLLGEAGLVELVNAVAYYVALAAMLNAFDVHPPKDLDDPWPASQTGV
jgi:4-carboxymuconolactone decarboxylase